MGDGQPLSVQSRSEVRWIVPDVLIRRSAPKGLPRIFARDATMAWHIRNILR